RPHVAAHRAPAEFRRREGGELQQRKVPRDLPRRAGAAAGLRHADRRRVPPAVGAARRRRLVLGRRLDLPQPLRRALRRRQGGRVEGGAGAAIQDDTPVAPVSRPVSVVPQGRHGHHGPSGGSDAAAAAHRQQGAPGFHPQRARGARHPRQRTARLVTAMPDLHLGLVHTPVTPVGEDGRIDVDRYAAVLEFHAGNGADALALPMHIGESVSLSEDKKREVLRFAIGRVKGTLPIIAHVSNAGTAIAAALARDAQGAGAAAIVATTPYYSTPPPSPLLPHSLYTPRPP